MARISEFMYLTRIITRHSSATRISGNLFRLQQVHLCGCGSRASSSVIKAGNDTKTSVAPSVGSAGDGKAQKISQAMKAYLERAKAQDEFMHGEEVEFEIGKRHLANIMGVDVHSLGQDQIDEALEYLLPSGLFDKKARPMMKPPAEVIPKRKAAQFAMDGRPFHSMFYTGIPNYYQLMHDISITTEKLKQEEDKSKARGAMSATGQKMVLAGSVWVEKKVLEKYLNEKLSVVQYEAFKLIMERLASQTHSKQEEEFVMTFRRPLVTKSLVDEIKPLLYDEAGRAFAEAEGLRKKACSYVKLWPKGSGQVSINGKDLVGFFPSIIDREQVMFPLQFAEKLGEVDFEARVVGGGQSGQAGSLRLALSLALCSVVSPAEAETMRLAGLLTEDPRVKERKKPGQARARKKFTWKKR